MKRQETKKNWMEKEVEESKKIWEEEVDGEETNDKIVGERGPCT